MVKKIEVLSVAEKNDEATLKLELIAVQAEGGANPKAQAQPLAQERGRVQAGRNPTG